MHIDYRKMFRTIIEVIVIMILLVVIYYGHLKITTTVQTFKTSFYVFRHDNHSRIIRFDDFILSDGIIKVFPGTDHEIISSNFSLERVIDK